MHKNLPPQSGRIHGKSLVIPGSTLAMCRLQSTKGDLRLSDPPTGLGVADWARARDRTVHADLWADLLSTLLPTPHTRE
ncbi:hypothetical protein PoB_004516900 [Plakobranchus ocellatus]|uniref:Uncharacterized protein n=1 Tax=Plakobranchus ocellatus TaxID=259542 RepID=A0AAV4BEX9_9GAST|nr:hypothetical protein PoB_004516900 [Plakobranchus ocellatus]